MQNILQTKKVRPRIIRTLILSILFLLFFIFLINFNRIEKSAMVNTDGRTFEKATVSEVLQDNLQEDGSRVGNQIVLLKMRTGPLKGQLVEATSPDGYLFGAECRPGLRVIAICSVSGDQSVVTVYNTDRSLVIYLFVALFLLGIGIAGGKNGFQYAIGLIFTFICILFLYLPMIYKGTSPFWAAVLVASLTTVVTMYCVGGISIKSISASAGTVVGVLVSSLAASLFGHFARIDGYNVSDIETLLFVQQATDIKIGELLFSGILIASLGAVMDVSMSIASTMQEVHEKNGQLTRLELFRSGINVGRDMMGTTVNTFILAFTGSSLNILILNYAYNLPYRQLINSYSIGIEIIQGISGGMGIVFCVPLVSLIASYLLTLPFHRTTHGESTEKENESA
jgi:uncharacterized membrane protein